MNTSTATSSSTTPIRQQHKSDSEKNSDTSNKKTQQVILEKLEDSFFKANLNGKRKAISEMSNMHFFQILKKEKGHSLIKAAISHHPYFIDCLKKLDEKQLGEICSIVNKDGVSVGISLIHSSDDSYLFYLLSCFKTEKFIKNFFSIYYQMNVSPVNDCLRKNRNLHTKEIDQTAIILNKLFHAAHPNLIGSIFHDLHTFEALSHISRNGNIAHFLSRQPFSDKKIKVLFTLLKKEWEAAENDGNSPPNRSSLFYRLIQDSFDSISSEEKHQFLQNNLFEIYDYLNSSQEGAYLLGYLLDIIKIPNQPLMTSDLLEMTDDTETTFLERILTDTNSTSKKFPAALLLDFKDIDTGDLQEILERPSTTMPDKSIMIHFLQAIALGKLSDTSISFRYLCPKISEAIVKFLANNIGFYQTWITNLFQTNIENCCLFYQLLQRELQLDKWKDCLFFPNLKHFSSDIAFLIAIEFALHDDLDPPFTPSLQHFRQTQLDFIGKKLNIRIEEFKKLSNKNNIEYLQNYTNYLYLYILYEKKPKKLIQLLVSPAFKRLMSYGFSKTINLRFLLLKLIDFPHYQVATMSQDMILSNFVSSTNSQKKNFLLLCIEKGKVPNFISTEFAIGMLIQDNQLTELNNPKVQKWLARDFFSAQYSYWKIESQLLSSLALSTIENDDIKKARKNACHFLQFLTTEYQTPNLILFFPEGMDLINHFQSCFHENLLKGNDTLYHQARIKLITRLIFFRLQTIPPVALIQILRVKFANYESFFSRIMLHISYSTDDFLTLPIYWLKQLISSENLIQLLREHLQSANNFFADFHEKTFLPILEFFLILPKREKIHWLRKIFMQEGVMRYKRSETISFSFLPSLNISPSHRHSQKINQWKMCNLLRNAVGLESLREMEFTQELLHTIMVDMTKIVLDRLTLARENDEKSLSIQEKEELVIPLYLFFKWANIPYIQFFSSFLSNTNEPDHSSEMLSRFKSLLEKKLLFNFLTIKHLELESYPVITSNVSHVEDVDLTQLLTIFNEFTYSDKQDTSSPSYLDLSEMYAERCSLIVADHNQHHLALHPNQPIPPPPVPTKQEYKAYLNKLFNTFILVYIPERVAVTGLSSDPVIRNQEYHELEQNLRVITAFLVKQNKLASEKSEVGEKARVNLRAFLPILAGLNESCATRWKSEIEQLLNIISEQREPVHFSHFLPIFEECILASPRSSHYVNLAENYKEYLNIYLKNNLKSAPLTQRQYNEFVTSQMKQLILTIIPQKLLKWHSSNEENLVKEYTKIENLFQILSATILQQKELFKRGGAVGKNAKNQIQEIFVKITRLLHNIDNGLVFIENLERIINEIENISGQISIYSKKGKLLKAIQRIYNKKIHKMQLASNTHYIELFRKLIWTKYPFLMENSQTIMYVDPIEPKIHLPNGTTKKFTLEDIEDHFFEQHSFADLETDLLIDLNDSNGLKKHYSTESIVDDLIFELKRQIIDLANTFQFTLPNEKINEIIFDLMPIFYEKDNFNKFALAFLLQHSNLQQSEFGMSNSSLKIEFMSSDEKIPEDANFK